MFISRKHIKRCNLAKYSWRERRLHLYPQATKENKRNTQPQRRCVDIRELSPQFVGNYNL